jgi:hypothetical protein
VDRRKKVIGLRRVWRMTTEAPFGEIVDFDPTAPVPAILRVEAPLAVLDPAPVSNWRASSHDLLDGLDVTDQTDSIPGELFDKLFSR